MYYFSLSLNSFLFLASFFSLLFQLPPLVVLELGVQNTDINHIVMSAILCLWYSESQVWVECQIESRQNNSVFICKPRCPLVANFGANQVYFSKIKYALGMFLYRVYTRPGKVIKSENRPKSHRKS